MRADLAVMTHDFDLLASRGFSGVRIFPQWRQPAQDAGATLLDASGAIRSEGRWDHFEAALKEAASCGLLVDVTFNRESLPAFSVEAYGRGTAAVARRLKGTAPHVLFDLQNERNHPLYADMTLTDEEVRILRDTVKAADPGRLVTLSTLGGPDVSLALSRTADLDVIAYHEPQAPGWHEQTPGLVARLLESRKPVYLQEGARAPDRGVRCELDPPPAANPLLQGMREARAAGAAAWTFHTDAGFRLQLRRFADAIRACPVEWDFVEGLRGR